MWDLGLVLCGDEIASERHTPTEAFRYPHQAHDGEHLHCPTETER